MNKAEELVRQALQLYESRKPIYVNDWAKKVDPSQNFYKEMTDYTFFPEKVSYYQMVACITAVKNPRLVLEMGAETGAGTVFIASEMPADGKIYTVDVLNDWRYVPDWETRIIKLHGDDTDISTYPKDFPWSDLDLVYVDSEHTVSHVYKQLNLVRPHLKTGAVIINDDIWNDWDYIPRLLQEQPWDYWEDQRQIKPSGMAVQVVR